MESKSSELIVVSKNELKKTQTVFDDFSLPILVSDFQEDSRKNLISLFGVGSVAGDAANKTLHSGIYQVEIPGEFIDGLRCGKLKLDNSSKIQGNFTPNIRDAEGNLVGQATIKEGVDSQIVTTSVMNVAMMTMLAEVSKKLDEMNETLEEIKTGQKNDRVAKAISGFEAFYYAYKSDKLSPEEKRASAVSAFQQMDEGINQIHFDLEAQAKKISRRAPGSSLMAALYGIEGVTMERRRYDRFEADLALYYQLRTLAVMIASYAYGSDAAYNEHQKVTRFCERIFTDKFMCKVCYLCDKPVQELLPQRIMNANKQLAESRDFKKIVIEVSQKEFNQLM